MSHKRKVAGLSAASLALVVVCIMPRGVGAEPGPVGTMLDAGVPDGVVASLVIRPISRLSLHGGLGYNLISPGVRVGATLAPIRWWVTPSVSVEAGRYFVGNANGAAEMFDSEDRPAGSDEPDNPILREIGYDFANFHFRLELGSSRFSYYLQAGFSGIRGEVRNLDEALSDDDDESDGPRVEIRQNPRVQLWIPSARTGFILFF